MDIELINYARALLSLVNKRITRIRVFIALYKSSSFYVFPFYLYACIYNSLMAGEETTVKLSSVFSWKTLKSFDCSIL